MSEGKTTGVFALIAIVSLGLAWWSKPDAITSEQDLTDTIPGTLVFKDFEDPDAASTFQIVKYDEELGQLDRFEVAQEASTGLWKIPSHDDYPADAAEQVRDATTPLVGLEILSVESVERGDHSLFGVLNPDDEDLTVGESGVGMLVRFKDESDQILASLIVGKEVEGSENLRYVRKPTEDAVYVVQLDTSPFTTKFQDWIEGELLGVRSFDIDSIGLRDYVLLPTQSGYGISRNFDADLNYEASSGDWSLERLVTYEEGSPQEEPSLPEGQQLNSTALNNLRNAIQDLEIVNVRRKPKGLAADLKADKSLMQDQDSLRSLVEQGFVPQETAEGNEIFATGGETLVGTQDGVLYNLRFGEAVANLTSGDEEDEDIGLQRYLLVSAKLDESRFPPPDLEPVPETVEEMLAREAALNGEGDSSSENAPEESQPEPAESAEASESESQDAPADETSEEAAKVEDNAAEADSAAEDVANEKAVDNKQNADSTGNGDATDNEDGGDTAAGDAQADNAPPKPESAPENEGSEQSGSEPAEASGGNSEEEPAEPTSSGDQASRLRIRSTSANNSTFVSTRASQAENQDDEPQAAGEEAQASEEQTTQEAAEEDEQAPSGEESTAADSESPAADGSDEPASDEPASEGDSEAEATEESADADGSSTADELTQEELEEQLLAVREEIAKENQRKIDERNEKMDEARRKVQELNARFADWYYVVSDSVYKKLKISRDQLTTAEGEDSGNDASSGNAFPSGIPTPNFQGGFPGNQ